MFDIDPVILGRLQFAVTVSLHILFPTLTIGLAAFLALLEGLWLKTNKELYLQLYKFWVKIFALAFGMGVVSGLVLSYQFGTNWSEFSRIGGPVLGPLIGYEVLTAFFLEAGFLGVMLFGWKKVGPKLHFLSTCLVAIGTSLSAFWILSANSWMQSPAGAEIIDGVFHPQDWLAIIFNPSFPFRMAHMMVASFLTTSLVITGVSAYYLLRDRHLDLARKGFSMGLWGVLILAPTQLVIGDFHGIDTMIHQPAKLAAIEGNWETQSCAPMVLFAIPDETAQTNRLEVSVPCLASLYLTHSWNGEVPGLKDYPNEQPPVAPVFWAFRVMVGLGVIFILLGLWGGVTRLRGKLNDNKALQRVAMVLTPAGFLAVEAGWYTTEIGRQPYTIYGYLTTAESASPVVNATAITTTLTIFLLVYGALFGAFLYYMVQLIRRGPTSPESEVGKTPEAIRGARPGLLVEEDDTEVPGSLQHPVGPSANPAE